MYASSCVSDSFFEHVLFLVDSLFFFTFISEDLSFYDSLDTLYLREVLSS